MKTEKAIESLMNPEPIAFSGKKVIDGMEYDVDYRAEKTLKGFIIYEKILGMCEDTEWYEIPSEDFERLSEEARHLFWRRGLEPSLN